MRHGSIKEKVTFALMVLTSSSVMWGCASQPHMTKLVYEDRAAWIRLETNPGADQTAPEVVGKDLTPLTSSVMTALLKGFSAEKDYNAGPISMALGKTYFNKTFVEAELMILAPQLTKGLAMASPKERVAYCLTADYSSDERFITTGWAYLKDSHLYFKLVEWRTPVRVKSPATPTSEACLVKPIPGTKTADRFFQLDYEPKHLILTHGPMGKSIYDKRGEVVFKLAELDLQKLQGSRQESRAPQNSSSSIETSRPSAVQTAPNRAGESEARVGIGSNSSRGAAAEGLKPKSF